ncbi:MAG: lysophospholipid acyltransferase family protein [Candidatus Hydrogenedentes bacterium]|nr:lysophospholipid acyltransferase family protein [Candidatus Hydrogenedentota bacterium]
MAHGLNRLLRAAIAHVSVGFARALSRLPIGFSRRLARALTPIVYRLVPRVRSVGVANLDLAYGDTLTAEEKRRILYASIENMLIVALELFQIPKLEGAFLDRNIPKLEGAFLDRNIRVNNLEHLPRDTGCVVIGAHHGNWEWSATAMARRGYKACEIVREFDHPYLDAYIDATRCSTGVVTIPKDKAAKGILERLADGYIVGILADQNPRENAVPVTFFGQPCWATIGPALAAARARVPVVAVSIARDPDGGYTVEFSPPIPMVHSERLRDDLLENTQRCQDALEALVRRAPEQWLWLHRRWKKRPNLEEEWKRRMAEG